MIITDTTISKCKYIELDSHEDARGSFQELFNSRNYPFTAGQWKQVNYSNSRIDVVRGIHVSPYSKLVTCLSGKIWDVVVDLRPGSPTFKQWYSVELFGNRQLYVPADCGHGFLSLADESVVLYMQGGSWSERTDRLIAWNDPKIGIDWPKPVDRYILSDKDAQAPRLEC